VVTTDKGKPDPIVTVEKPGEEALPALKSTMIMTAANIAAMDGTGEGQTKSVSGVTSAGIETIDLETLDEETLAWRRFQISEMLLTFREDGESAGTECRASLEANEDAKSRLEIAEEKLRKAQEAKRDAEANLEQTYQALRAAEAKQADLAAKLVNAEDELKKADDAIAARDAKKKAELEQEEEAARLLAQESAQLKERLEKAETQRLKREANADAARAAIGKLHKKDPKKPE